MTIETIRHVNLSLEDQLITFSPSALKYWCSGILNFLISIPSGVKPFTSLFSNWRLRLSQVGINQYVAITARAAKVCRAVSFVNKRLVEKIINIRPVMPDFKITFRSLLREFIMIFSITFGSIYRLIVSQINTKVSIFLAVLLCFIGSSSAFANQECLAAITKYEKLYDIPTGLLKAVSKIESEYNPLALNDGLKTHKFQTTGEVIDRISYLIEIGKTNFDVGCMQINYYWHGKNFSSIEEMLDVNWNVRYAASLIKGLYNDHGSWQVAVRHYHSYEPKFYMKYSKKIALAWLQEK